MNINLRQFLSITAFLLTVSATSCTQGQKDAAQNEEEPAPPNFVLLMSDDQGWDEVGYSGHPHLKTPVLDEMARNGLRFDRFYSGHSSCSPTRGSFMTGRHPNRYGTFTPNWSIRPEETTIAHILGKAGYVSAHFGKWHLGPVKEESPTSPGAMGFDEWLSHDNFFEMNPTLSRNGGPPEQFKGEGSQLIVDEAIQFIEKAKEDRRPFLVVIWYGSPHEPYSGLPGDLDLYQDLPGEYADQTVGLTSNETGRRVDRPLDEVLQERYAEITAMDRSIGILRDYLKEEGLRDNTVFWFCSDNGTPPSAARTAMTLRAQKGTVYEGGIRVPGIIEWPKYIKEPRVSQFNAVTSDVLPTICGLAGQPLPNRPLDGVSLEAVIKGEAQNRPNPLYFWHFDAKNAFDDSARPYIDPTLQVGTVPLVKIMNGKYTRTFRNLHYDAISQDDLVGARAMIDNQYKLVLQAEGGGDNSLELFDLGNDPGETTNLAGEHPEIVASMREKMLSWQQSVLRSLNGQDY